MCPADAVVARAMRRLAAGGGRLAFACLLALTLAAVQFWPSWSWTRTSSRALSEQQTVRSVPEWLARGAPLRCGELSGIFQPPQAGTHAEARYRFSIGPWRWAELVWPAAGGRPFPVHARWMHAIPAEGAYWTPSLYMGLWPALLGLTALRLRGRSDRHQRWLSWWVVLSVLACLGEYGLGWLANEVLHAWGSACPRFWSPVGGLYWLLAVLLPGFDLFRYPAKFWCVAALGLSLLAARHLEALNSQSFERWGRRTRWGVLLLLLVLPIGWLLRDTAAGWLRATPADALYGPLQMSAVWHDLSLSGLHILIVLAAAWIIITFLGRTDPQRAKTGLLLLTAVELARAQVWMVPTVARAEATRPPTVAQMQKETPRWPGASAGELPAPARVGLVSE